MSYITIDSVVKAYNGCKGKTQNKFWGLLAILKAIDQQIIPGKSYTFQTSIVSSILDDLFCFSEGRTPRRGSDCWSVLFSRTWLESIPEVMFDAKPNIYDVTVWFFRKENLPENINSEELLTLFLNSLHLTKKDLETLFDMSSKEITYSLSPYTERDLLVKIIGNDTLPDMSKLSLSFEGTTYLKSDAGNLGQASFVQTLYSGQKPQKCLILTQFDFNKEYRMVNNHNSNKGKGALQQIFYGAPGTGKSHKIKNDEMVRTADGKDLVFRTTFHPDSDYSTFVGAYKPKSIEVPVMTIIGKEQVSVVNAQPEKKIVYSFVPQAFLQAYIAAWNHPDEPVFLVIEEINRGNCAQIFGDLFQLLDRDDEGWSEYPIKADADLTSYLTEGKDEDGQEVLTNKDGIKDGKLRLPKNLYIWATMNTSDQSLFPIDSAFKRRWDWVYQPIDTAKETWYIKVGESYYSWTAFLNKVNDELLTDETAEDKHLGFYFCKATEKKNGTEVNPNVITKETFVGKVLFYLWNDVFKVYGIPQRIGSSKEWPYRRFYRTNGDVDEERVAELMEKLQIAAEGNNENREEETEG